MDSVCKLVSKILQQRLDKILIEHGLECQNGFMGGRGTTDGISILYQALLKRREHQQASWVVLLDLIKAFPGVPRELMFEILSKFGVPPKMVALIKQLHTNVVAKFAIGTGDDETTTCTIVIHYKCDNSARPHDQQQAEEDCRRGRSKSIYNIIIILII